MEKTAGRRVRQGRLGQKAVLGEREKRRLAQLLACLALFGAVFCTRGLDKLEGLRTNLNRVLTMDADFQSAFSQLGRSLSLGRPVGQSLNDLWTDVFLPQERQAPAVWREGPLYEAARKELCGGGDALFPLAVGERQAPSPMAQSVSRTQPQAEAGPPEAAPTPEPEVVHMDYTGPALPDNATMDRYALGLAQTVTPVKSRITSGYGWREHPVEGGEKFHRGVDLKADVGTPVLAFAAGMVEYIGESDSYGQYLQLRHDNGVATFYAHCSKLCVQQGQTVEAGEKVAESGATGEVTGPHLHFEMTKDGVRLNPAYYIESGP